MGCFRLFLTSILLTFSFYPLFTQVIRCSTTSDQVEIRKEQDQEYKIFHDQWREYINTKLGVQHKSATCPGGTIKVPLAFHFDSGIVPGAQEACMLGAALEFVEELNLEVAGADQDAGLFALFTACLGDVLGDACIEFVLANANHPVGYGLSEGDPAVTFGVLDFTEGPGDNTPRDANWAGYLNVFIKDVPGLLGVSNGIPGDFSGDGVTIVPCTFGSGNITCPGVDMSGVAGCFSLYDQGETLVHELGHYLGLYHIWGDDGSSCAGSDMIADTPNMGPSYNGYDLCGSHNSCVDLPSTCSSEDMYMNFMSYASDHCYYMLTQGQGDVMNATADMVGFTTDYPGTYNPNYLNCTDIGDVVIGEVMTMTDETIMASGSIESAATISNSSTVIYQAATGIEFVSPFTIQADNSEFTALTDDCLND